MTTTGRTYRLSLSPYLLDDRRCWYGQGPLGTDTVNGWGAEFVLHGIQIDSTEPPLVAWRWDPESGWTARINWYGERPESWHPNGHTDLGSPRTLLGLTYKVRMAVAAWRGVGKVTIKNPKLDSLVWPGEW